jgi:hypothetical protein
MRQQNDVDGRVAIAQAYNLIGNLRLRTGDKAGAIAAWQAALAGWPSNTAETPRQLAIRMQLLGAVGQIEEAGALRQKLNAMGYRQLI